MSQVSTWKQILLLVMATLSWLIFLAPISTFAETLPCENIEAPGYFFNDYGNSNLVSRAIADCTDPFSVTTEPASPYTVTINGEEVVNGETIFVENGLVEEYIVSGDGYFNYLEKFLFKHEGDNYVYVDEELPEPTEDDYRDFARDYFPTSEEANQYLEILLVDFETRDIDSYLYYGENYDYLIDAVTGQTIEDRYYDFKNAVYEYLNNRRFSFGVGTYTLVMRNSELIMTDSSTNPLWQNIKDFLVKTAYAETQDGRYVYAVTFTLTEEKEQPAGASNILFIPGIMGSRLYENSEECGLFETEERERWYSRSTCDQLRLKTNYLGQSQNDIYTYARESAIVDEITFPGTPDPNIYEALLEDLQAWESEGTINDYGVLPYDWRLRLDDLIKMKRDETTNKVTLDSDTPLNQTYLYETLSSLAQSSKNGKVTVVAHSNGGLLIKYFLNHLSLTSDPLASRIDNLILVAVPQVGTPDAVTGILHGVKLDLVMDQDTARTIMNTAPFGQHLLPHPSYFSDTDGGIQTPAISFEPGLITDDWLDTFGPNIQTFNDLKEFMIEESGREVPEEDNLSLPAVINTAAFTYVNQVESALADWQPNSATKVYQIAGVGLETPSGLTYFTDVKCTGRSFFSCVSYEKQLGYRINSVLDGDATVVSPSALFMSENDQVERWWVDLVKFNNDTSFDRVHRDILEVEDIRNFVINMAKANTSDSYPFLDDTPPTLSEGERLIFQLHSPLDMFVVLDDGVVVGSSTPFLRGVQYHRYGELQFLSIPESEVGYEVRLSGIATGSFTLDIDSYIGDNLSKRSTYSAIPSSTSTEVVFRLNEAIPLEEIVLEIDYEGDGEFELIALPGLAALTSATTTTPAVTDVRSGGSASATKVKKRTLPLAAMGELSSATINIPEQELVLQFIKLLTQYRDLLIFIKVK